MSDKGRKLNRVAEKTPEVKPNVPSVLPNVQPKKLFLEGNFFVLKTFVSNQCAGLSKKLLRCTNILVKNRSKLLDYNNPLCVTVYPPYFFSVS